MNIVVPVKLVPDLVEELTIDETGTALDAAWLRLILNEFDDHAIEQAILLAERSGAEVTVIGPDMEGVEDVLYAAAARGAHRLIKLTGDVDLKTSNHALACSMATTVAELRPDLVLTGVQTHNDLDGALGSLLAGYLEMPYVGYIAGVTANNGSVLVRKEYPGGLVAEMEVTLPAVLGIQAAEEPPRYVAFTKIRQAMKTVEIEERGVTEMDLDGAPTIGRMFQPEAGERADILEGELDDIAAGLVALWQKQGLL